MATDNSVRPDCGVGDGGQDRKPRALMSIDSKGMTLRDYFAAGAMQAILADSSRHISHDSIAPYSYLVADAMLAQRETR